MGPTPASAAECPAEVFAHYGVNSNYQHMGDLVCGRTCVREMQGIGYTPNGLDIPAEHCVGAHCPEARIVAALAEQPPIVQQA